MELSLPLRRWPRLSGKSQSMGQVDASIDALVERERAIYEEGLRRRNYNLMLRHTHHLYRTKRRELAGRLLSNVPHATMLEIGCDAWVHFAEPSGIQPKTLICSNIARRELDKGIAAARHTRLQPDFRLMDAHKLEFPDHHFDVVFGMSILHHLKLEVGLREVRRVLKPGGFLLFAEPLDMNPIGRLVRRLTPQARTLDERPFRSADLALIKRYFDCNFYYEQLLSVPLGVLSGLFFPEPDNLLMRLAFRLDENLAHAFPALGPYHRHVLIAGRPWRAVD
jgi:SAM-dependent methyltransferase